jgi:hypothetical protein
VIKSCGKFSQAFLSLYFLWAGSERKAGIEAIICNNATQLTQVGTHLELGVVSSLHRALFLLTEIHHGNSDVGNRDGCVSTSDVLLQSIVDEGVLGLCR